MNIKLYYQEKGSGEPLILLHGNNEDSSYFVHQIEEFSKNFRVIAIDTRGHGNSPRGDAPFTIRQFAEDLKSFMDGKALAKAHILGFSDGANIAMIFAMKYPDYVGKLILNGGNLYAQGVKSYIQLPIIIGYRIAKLFARRSKKAKKTEEMLGLMVINPNISSSELKAIKSQTLVLAGTKDMIKDNHTKLIAESIQNSELFFIEGSHFVANKRPDEFNKVIRRFLLVD